MISDKIQQAVNKQINTELFSAYFYLSMSAYFQSKSLTGFAHWMEIQATEEFFHSKKFYDYLVGRGGRVLLTSIEQPKLTGTPPNMYSRKH
jgi:ferritin